MTSYTRPQREERPGAPGLTKYFLTTGLFIYSTMILRPVDTPGKDDAS